MFDPNELAVCFRALYCAGITVSCDGIVGLCAGCAVTAGAQVGLDVEETQRLTRGDPLRLARRRFSPKEIASLEGGPPLLLSPASRGQYMIECAVRSRLSRVLFLAMEPVKGQECGGFPELRADSELQPWLLCLSLLRCCTCA